MKASPTNGPTDGRTDGRADPLIEMRGQHFGVLGMPVGQWICVGDIDKFPNVQNVFHDLFFDVFG